MTNEEARIYFIDSNERIISIAKDENGYNYETQQIEDVFMRRDFEAKELAIKALKQQPCEDTIDRKETEENIHREREQAYMQGYEDASKKYREEYMRDATAEERKSTSDYINSISKATGVKFCDAYENVVKGMQALSLVTSQPKVGKWIGVDNGVIYCSKCNEEAYWDTVYGQRTFDFCPFCGADMREVNADGNSD